MRTFDLIFSFVLLLVFLPVIVFVAILVRIFLGSPVIFKQIRPGYKAKPFMLYKFRSMSNKRNNDGTLLDDGARLTKFGKMLRASSLDELPQLWNILKGDMSFVGPRPLLMEYLPLYTKKQAQRHNVKPGVTGLAQVMGRNNITHKKKFFLDTWYVEHKSFCLDINILLRTAKVVLLRHGVCSKGCATYEKFNGKN